MGSIGCRFDLPWIQPPSIWRVRCDDSDIVRLPIKKPARRPVFSQEQTLTGWRPKQQQQPKQPYPKLLQRSTLPSKPTLLHRLPLLRRSMLLHLRPKRRPTTMLLHRLQQRRCWCLPSYRRRPAPKPMPAFQQR